MYDIVYTWLCLSRPWLLPLSRQGICCLNSVQDLQNYDLYKCLSPSSSLKLMLQNDYPFWIFSKAISRRVIKILAYNGGVLNRHRSRAAGYLNSGFTCQQIRYSNSLWCNGYYFINGYGLFYNGRNSPESLQAYDPALGGYIIQNEITSNMQVPCHCQHAPWHLGANAKSFFTQLIEDPTHHIVMSRPLMATNGSSQKFKVHKH